MICQHLVDRLSLLECLLSILRIPFTTVRDAQMQKGAGRLRIERGCFQVILDCLVKLLTSLVSAAEIDIRICLLRPGHLIGNLLIGTNRIGKVAPRNGINCIEMQLVTRGQTALVRQGIRGKQFIFRLLGIIYFQVSFGQSCVRRRKLRIQRDRLLQRFARLKISGSTQCRETLIVKKFRLGVRLIRRSVPQPDTYPGGNNQNGNGDEKDLNPFQSQRVLSKPCGRMAGHARQQLSCSGQRCSQLF